MSPACPFTERCKDCDGRLVDVGADKLDQSGTCYLPARRYAKDPCPYDVIQILPTGEEFRCYE